MPIIANTAHAPAASDQRSHCDTEDLTTFSSLIMHGHRPTIGKYIVAEDWVSGWLILFSGLDI